MIDEGEIPPVGWNPTVRATLLFVIEPTRILLIEKKRGLGAGKINGPGGKLEPGETAEQAVIREAHEEIGICPTAPLSMAKLFFSFADGFSLECEVFTAHHFEGRLIETEEARPFWCPLDAIPYDRMWEDDRYWLPAVLAGDRVTAWFSFTGDRMTDKRVLIHPG
jgi:8-oxo-dGTP diphosphatase